MRKTLDLRRAVLAPATALWLLVAVSLPATTLAPITFDEQLDVAETIFRGKVVERVSRWQNTAGGRAIFTRVTFETLESFKGSAPARYAIDLLGGAVGEDELLVEGMPQFVSGREYIVFVSANSAAACPVVGWRNGSLPVIRTGGEAIVELPSTAAAAAPAIRRRAASTGPDTAPLDAFTQHLREKLRSRPQK